MADARDLLAAALAEASRQVEDRTREHAALIEAAIGSNGDDEHDPEGATLAFEREQAAALLLAARNAERELRAAVDRQSTGTYGRCESCHLPIAASRLQARPAARQCRECAATTPL